MITNVGKTIDWIKLIHVIDMGWYCHPLADGVGKTMPCLPPMTGKGKHATYKIVMTGGWFMALFYLH